MNKRIVGALFYDKVFASTYSGDNLKLVSASISTLLVPNCFVDFEHFLQLNSVQLFNLLSACHYFLIVQNSSLDVGECSSTNRKGNCDEDKEK